VAQQKDWKFSIQHMGYFLSGHFGWFFFSGLKNCRGLMNLVLTCLGHLSCLKQCARMDSRAERLSGWLSGWLGSNKLEVSEHRIFIKLLTNRRDW